VTVEHVKGTETVSEVKIKYFDTIPPCVSVCVLKKGFLFAASEFGNHALYQFAGIGDDDDDVESSSATLVETEEARPEDTLVPHFLSSQLQLSTEAAVMYPSVTVTTSQALSPSQADLK